MFRWEISTAIKEATGEQIHEPARETHTDEASTL